MTALGADILKAEFPYDVSVMDRAAWADACAELDAASAVPWVLLAHAETKLTSSLTGLLIAAVPLVGAVLILFTGADEKLGKMAITGLDSAAGVELDEVAVAPVVPSCAFDRTVGGRIDRRSMRTGEVDSGVHCCAAAEWV